MRIKVYAIGKIKEAYLKVGIEEYLTRIRPYANIEIIEVSCVVEHIFEVLCVKVVSRFWRAIWINPAFREVWIFAINDMN